MQGWISGAVLAQTFRGHGPSAPYHRVHFIRSPKPKEIRNPYRPTLARVTSHNLRKTKHRMNPCTCGTILNNKMKIGGKVEIHEATRQYLQHFNFFHRPGQVKARLLPDLCPQ